MRAVLTALPVLVIVCAMGADAQAQQARLDKGEIIVTTKAVEGSDIPKATVKAVIDAPPADIWHIVSRCADYKKTMVRVLEAKEVSRKGNNVVCEVTTDMPWPLDNLTARTKIVHKVGPPQWTRSWQLISGDFKSNKGSWTISPFDATGKRSLVVYRLHVVPDVAIPDAIIRKGMASTLPDLIEHLRKTVKKP